MTAPVEVNSSVIHGSVSDAELAALGVVRGDLLDLSSNLHPAGPDTEVLAAFRGADVSHYPSTDGEPLRSLIARHHELDPDQVLVTAGATAAIHLAARALLGPGDRCALFTPTFGEYEHAIRLAGGEVVELPLPPPAFERPRGAIDADLAILCNPNNPTGNYLERREVEALLPRTGSPLILDVAYDAFVDNRWDADSLVREDAPLLVIHSMTKLHAIPGLRIGYVTGPAALLRRLEALQTSWPVSSPALAAGAVALRQDVARRAALSGLSEARQTLRGVFERVEVDCAPSKANFVLARVGDAAGFRKRLIEDHRIVVRDASSFGLPDWVRVALPPAERLGHVAGALEAALAERPR